LSRFALCGFLAWSGTNYCYEPDNQISEADARILEVKARAQGLSVEEYALRVIKRELAPDWLRRSWASAVEAGLDELSLEEIGAEIAVARRDRRADGSRRGE
jgi:hypothetical protein